MENNTNQTQKEALMKGSPWLKDLMLNPHLNKFMKMAESKFNKSSSQTIFVETKSFTVIFIKVVNGRNPIVKVVLKGADPDSSLLLHDDSKINVYHLILRYACLEKGMIVHQHAPGVAEAIQFTNKEDIPGKDSTVMTFFDLFYFCKHRNKVENKESHKFYKNL